jgi:hypothetical protein
MRLVVSEYAQRTGGPDRRILARSHYRPIPYTPSLSYVIVTNANRSNRPKVVISKKSCKKSQLLALKRDISLNNHIFSKHLS